jgi:uncharacterized protein (TIGR00251 family)
VTLPSWLVAVTDGVAIDLHVVPRSSRTALCGEHGGRLKLSVAAPPADGRANKVIVAFLAKKLGVAKAAVEISSGASGRRKRVVVRDVTPGDVMESFRM